MADSNHTYLYAGLGLAAAYLLLRSSSTAATVPTSTVNAGAYLPTLPPAPATATGGAPTSADSSAPATASTTAISSSDGAPHRGSANDTVLTNFSAADVQSIKTLSNYFRLTVEDVVDVVSFQEQQDRKGWSQIASEYAANPSWFHDKAVEYNTTNPKYRVNA